eukprot:773483-Alexandrium_andersonii.AAC.1
MGACRRIEASERADNCKTWLWSNEKLPNVGAGVRPWTFSAARAQCSRPRNLREASGRVPGGATN